VPSGDILLADLGLAWDTGDGVEPLHPHRLATAVFRQMSDPDREFDTLSRRLADNKVVPPPDAVDDCLVNLASAYPCRRTRSNSRSPTFRRPSGKRAYIISKGWITSGDELKRRTGLGSSARATRVFAARYYPSPRLATLL
jgi:hypothetical protein